MDGTSLVSFTKSSTVFACQCCLTFLFHCRRLVSFIARDDSRRGGRNGQTTNLAPLKIQIL